MYVTVVYVGIIYSKFWVVGLEMVMYVVTEQTILYERVK